MGLKDLGGIKSSLTGVDLFTDLAEKVSASMTPKEEADHTSEPAKALGDSTLKKDETNLPKKPECLKGCKA